MREPTVQGTQVGVRTNTGPTVAGRYLLTCVRCGLRRPAKGRRGNLCSDCRMVARDLGELEVWG